MADLTPVPWIVKNGDIYAADGEMVAAVRYLGNSVEAEVQTNQNRTRIAAVNEIYEALQIIKGHLDADDPNNYRADDPEGAMDTAFERARIALAKADLL